MYLQVRLYINHDYDLITLKSLPYISLNGIMTSALRAFVRNEDYKIEIPENLPVVKFDKDLRTTLTFDDDKDADVIAFLNSLPDGFRNSFTKIITRNFIDQRYLLTLFGYEPKSE